MQASPEHKLGTNESRQILARFLEDQTDAASLKQVKDFLKDKVLSQFPIFALNEDYMRALAMIIVGKLERAHSLVH